MREVGSLDFPKGGLIGRTAAMVRRVQDMGIPSHAANAGYFIVLAVFPALVLVLSVLRYTALDAGDLLEPIIIDEKTDFDGDIFDHTVRLDFASGVSSGVEAVEVTAVMDESLKTRELTVPGKNIEDTGGKEGVSYTWDHSPVTVTLCGPLENITQITPEDIILRLNMSPYSETNTGTIKVRAEVVIDSAYDEGVFETGIYEIDVTFDN